MSIFEKPKAQYKTQWQKTPTKLNGKILNVFSLLSEASWGYLSSLLLFNIGVEVLDTAMREAKQIKALEYGLFLFADDMIVYVENSVETTGELLKLKWFSKISDKILV